MKLTFEIFLISDAPDLKDFMKHIAGNTYCCILCPDFPPNQYAGIKAHIESKHYTPGYHCPNCNKYYRIKNSLNYHYYALDVWVTP